MEHVGCAGHELHLQTLVEALYYFSKGIFRLKYYFVDEPEHVDAFRSKLICALELLVARHIICANLEAH